MPDIIKNIIVHERAQCAIRRGSNVDPEVAGARETPRCKQVLSFEDIREKHGEFKGKMQEVLGDADRLRTENRLLRHRVHHLEKTLESLEDRCDSNKMWIQTLEERIAMLESDSSKLRNPEKGPEKKAADWTSVLTSRLESLGNMNARLQQSEATLRQENEQLHNEVNILLDCINRMAGSETSTDCTPAGTTIWVPVDTTGDGKADAVGYDSTGNGEIDKIVHPTQGHSVVPLDTTGDGSVDSVGFDTTGDGILDTIVHLDCVTEARNSVCEICWANPAAAA
mmetsp:Transcript_13514/g.36463  ORF Transcript_13514/g.36463 Transcript_13514/m.36463 type:complete len:282 (+) Transcript_13514:46-891(+)